jgi:hypothetical protein
MRGCVVAWLRGCVVAWLRGCVVAWLRGNIGGWGASVERPTSPPTKRKCRDVAKRVVLAECRVVVVVVCIVISFPVFT